MSFEAIKSAEGDNARIYAAVKFNHGFGETQEGAEFGITLQAFKKDTDSSSHELRTDEVIFGQGSEYMESDKF